MEIKYSLVRAWVSLICGAFFGTIFNFVLLGMFVSDFDWLSSLLLLLIFGPLALGLNMLFLSGVISLTYGRVAFRFDEQQLTHYYGFWRRKQLIIPYAEIEEIGTDTRSLRDGIRQYFGGGKARVMQGVLRASEVVKPSVNTTDDVMSKPYEVLVIDFKEEGRALQFAKMFGIKLKSRLAYMDENNALEIELGPVAKFSIDEVIAYVEERKNRP